MDQKQVYLKNFGCKVNLADTQHLAYEFEHSGYQLTGEPAEAHVIVMNSCSVTHKAEQDARYHLRKYHRLNPTALKVITGCYAQIDSYRLAKLPEVDYIIPNQNKSQLVAFIQTCAAKPPASSTLRTPAEGKIIPGSTLVNNNRQGHFKSSLNYFGQQSSTQTRAFLKIQDGCNDFCSYCQIPRARGQSLSTPAAPILKQISTLIMAGTKELVLTGIHLGEWGKDLPGSPQFTDLLTQIFNLPTPWFRLRLSSLEPSECTPQLANLLHTYRHRLCAHLHFPLQSGSARILKLMRRRYSPDEYLRSVALARRALGPKVHLSADVMVGFPGETDEDFEQTMDLIRAADLASLHVFPYSKRPNTSALKLPDHLPPHVIQSRARALRELSNRRLEAFIRPFSHTKLQVLWEAKYDRYERILGKSSEYIRVCAAPGSVTPGSITASTAIGRVGAHTLLTKDHRPLKVAADPREVAATAS